MPSSLIPFCSFGSVLRGKYVPNFSLPVCDLFHPVVLDGKLCYHFDPVKEMFKERIMKGSGLTLVMDANIEKAVISKTQQFEMEIPGSLDVRRASESLDIENLVKVNIGTLTAFADIGLGSYILTDVKQISAKKGFLSMSEEKRECVEEKFEQCQQRLFHERIEQCGCTPQGLLPALQLQTQV